MATLKVSSAVVDFPQRAPANGAANTKGGGRMTKHELTSVECCVSHIQIDEDDVPGQCRQCRTCGKMIRPRDFDKECEGRNPIFEAMKRPGTIRRIGGGRTVVIELQERGEDGV